MDAIRPTMAAVLTAITVGCAQHTPPPPTSPSIPNSATELPTPPSTNPLPPNRPNLKSERASGTDPER